MKQMYKKVFGSHYSLRLGRLAALLMTVCFFVLGLVGCKKAPGTVAKESPDLHPAFSTRAEFSLGGDKDSAITANAIVSRTNSGGWVCDFVSPSTLQGIAIMVDDGQITASYLGLSFSLPESALPAQNAIKAFTAAADSLINAGDAEKQFVMGEDGVKTYEGEAQGTEFMLGVSDRDNSFVSFSCKKPALSITFSDFSANVVDVTDHPTTSTTTNNSAVTTAATTVTQTTSATTVNS